MEIQLCDKRNEIIAHQGHLLVLGGPGSGKTTVALIKAQRRFKTLLPGQEILFLSFSRAAVRQVLVRCREILTPAERRSVTVKTYHSFCLEMLESHGRLLRGASIKFVYPGDERLEKSGFDGDWAVEQLRLATEESQFCFDLFAAGTAMLLERCGALRQLIANRYPLIIVDEFQDTDNDQWRVIHAFAAVTEVFCLADADQTIFAYRDDVDPRRLDILRATIAPKEFDLGGENHRSPNTGILTFADAVLKNRAPLPITPDVKQVSYWNNVFAATVHAGVIWTFSALSKKGVTHPCVAVLCRSNPMVAELSGILAEEHTFNNRVLAPIDHDVVWDAELSAAAAIVVGSILEWPSGPAEVAVSRTLRCIATFYKLKDAEDPSNSAAENARKFDQAAQKVAEKDTPRIKAAKELIAACEAGVKQVGDPVVDWRVARRLLQDIGALNELFRHVRLVRLFRATDALASGLAELWLSSGTYAGATKLVKSILEQERLIAADRDPEGCILMNIHKAKGKEFDGVVLVEGAYKATFFDEREKPLYPQSRRLLRVAITRARTLVTIIRPHGARALVG
jgi:DNA helicase II / ATP-dependent DNA helicase PcrA